MRRLGDKIESKLLAEQAGVPLAPWSGGPVADLAEARAQAESIGYPLMVKATAGGGGRGIRLVQSPEQLEEAFERARSEASKTAGDATVFLERAIRGGRHVEVQVVADAAGTVWTLGVRDCSVQRRNQACNGATRRSSRSPPRPRLTSSRRNFIPPQFDSMIAKVIAWGRDRSEARARLSRALRQTATVIKGGTTTRPSCWIC